MLTHFAVSALPESLAFGHFLAPLQQISMQLAGALIASIWQGALLALGVSLGLRLLPGSSAATRSLIWMGVFVVLVMLHLAPAPHTVAATGALAALRQAHPLHLAGRWSYGIVALWGILSCLRLFQFLAGALRLREIARRATPIGLGATRQGASEVGGRHYRLCTSEDIDRPSVLGFLAPKILLPAGLVEALTPAELRQVLLHETEHLRRSDDWTNLLQKLALVLFPLNPVLFWVERRVCLERELACDDRVLAVAPAPKAYATCLTRIAEHGLVRRGMSLALGAFGRRSELATRVHRILERRATPGANRPAAALAAAGMFGAITLGSLSLAHAPRLVIFSPFAHAERAQAADDPLMSQRAEPLGGGAARTWGAKAVSTLAILPSPAPAERTVAGRRHLLATPPARLHEHVSRVARPLSRALSPRTQQALSAPRLVTTAGQAEEAPLVTRLVLSGGDGEQLRPILVPAIARYAALRTPNGWIIFRL